MTPEQKLKHLILIRAAEFDKTTPDNITLENIDELYNASFELRDAIYDAKNEIREGSVETKLTPEYSRHYESKSEIKKI